MFIDRKVSWPPYRGITGTKSLFFSMKMDKMSNRNIRPKIRNKLIEIKSLLNSQACVCEENEICVAFCFNHRVSSIAIKSIIYHFHVNLGKLFWRQTEGRTNGRTGEQTDIKFSLKSVPKSIPIVEYFFYQFTLIFRASDMKLTKMG